MTTTSPSKSWSWLDPIVGLLLLGIFLATNGYAYGWDDQHLEIPLLKSLINPQLYVGDYYVETLKAHFTSFLYPLLARAIHIEHIPAAFMGLYILVRYFFFLGTYKLWQVVSGRRSAALACTLMIILIGRVEEFLYRTFSHQEFALAIIAWGLYYFYRKRPFIASFLLGIAANFHVLYALFPMIYLSIDLLRERPVRWKTWFMSGISFLVSALPIVIWIGLRRLQPQAGGTAGGEWLELYRLACPQNFVFYDHTLPELFSSATTFFRASRDYWIVASLWLLNAGFNPVFIKDRRTKTVLWTGTACLIFSFVFSHVWPSRFVLDLNLVRHVQFMLYFLMGYTMLLAVVTVETAPIWVAAGLAVLFPLLRLGGYVVVWTALGMGAWLLFYRNWFDASTRQSQRNKILSGLALAVTLSALVMVLREQSYSRTTLWSLTIIQGTALAIIPLWYFMRSDKWRRRGRYLLIITPLLVFSAQYCYYHQHRLKVERTGSGFWQMQRAWIDMQNHVREHTPVDAVLLVPHDMEMGGFRMFAERQIVMSYRDCGVVGFDLAAGQEWEQRLADIGSFKVFVDGPVTQALVTALSKYQVDYIVFMNYMAPEANHMLQPVYANEVFALYQVRR